MCLFKHNFLVIINCSFHDYLDKKYPHSPCDFSKHGGVADDDEFSKGMFVLFGDIADYGFVLFDVVTSDLYNILDKYN